MKNRNLIICSMVMLTPAVMAQIKSDNTNINKRDRAAHEMTADQQSVGMRDTEISSRIRQELMKASDLSTYAQNIKIIAINGRVTMKGPVRTELERTKVLSHARSVAGASNVTDKISIVAK